MDLFDFLSNISLVLVAGGLPALLWLWLVLTEDRVHPEPRNRIIITFLAGMASVLFAIIFQREVLDYQFNGGLTIALWAAIEEILKFSFAAVFAIHTRDYDEPLDAVIYMAVAALGFAALENMLFIFSPIFADQQGNALLLAHARFLGSTIVHLISSIIVGLFIAETFFKNTKTKLFAIIIGLCIASVFHALFNLFIITLKSDSVIFTFLGLWIISMLVLLYAHTHKSKYVI